MGEEDEEEIMIEYINVITAEYDDDITDDVDDSGEIIGEEGEVELDDVESCGDGGVVEREEEEEERIA